MHFYFRDKKLLTKIVCNHLVITGPLVFNGIISALERNIFVETKW